MLFGRNNTTNIYGWPKRIFIDFIILFCVLLCIAVRPQFDDPSTKVPGPVVPNCCVKASNATIRETIDACFEQEENKFPYCKIHAYM